MAWIVTGWLAIVLIASFAIFMNRCHMYEGRIDALELENADLSIAIRRHMNARGHDRCWQNDEDLYRVAFPEEGVWNPRLPSRDEFERRCKEYADQQYGDTI